MSKHFCLISLLIFMPFTLRAQHTLRAYVLHSQTNAPVEMAAVRLLSPSDSSMVTGVQTNLDGYFQMEHVKSGNYILHISSIGYKDNVSNVSINGDVQLKNIKMKEDAALLESVEVRGTAVQLQVKGDTIEYNATAFKTPQDAVVEEMLKKMPGVEIDENGTITVNGEEIKNVRVDGKKFFGNDVQMATKNIPAEMIDKIQVLDKKSEMAELTGFEDDDTERIINLTLKPGMRRGYFANITGAGGVDVIKEGGETPDKYDPRYDANAFVNIMGDKSQTSIVAGANNTNTQRSGRGRKNMGQKSGITNTQNIGANTNVEVNEDLKLGGNLSGNHSTNVTENSSVKDTYIGENTFTNTDKTQSNRNNWDTRVILESEWQINDKSKLILQPEMAYTHAQMNSANEYYYYNKVDSLDANSLPFVYNDTTSFGGVRNNSTSADIDGGLRAVYNYKFDKAGRTITVDARANFSDSETDKMNYSEKTDNISTVTKITDNIIQSESLTGKYSARMSYVEPLYGNKHFLETVLGVNYTERSSIKNQYVQDGAGQYTLIDSVYSSNFSNTFFSQRAELNYRYKFEKVDFLAGARFNPSQTYSQTAYLTGELANVENVVWNFAPTVNLKYKFTDKTYLRLDYRGITGQPTIAQMEPNRNNSNPMQETIGNPNLEPSFSQKFKVFYSHYNTTLFSSFVTALSANIVQNALVNNSVYDITGKRYSQTVNSEAMPYQVFGMIMYNVPIIQKRLHFNTRTHARYMNQVGYTSQNVSDIDIENLPLGQLSKTGNLRLSEGLSLTFTHDVLELGAKGNVSYSRTENNLNDQINNVIDWNVTGNLSLYLPYDFSINTDIGYTDRYGYATTDLDELIWNASIDKSFLNKQAVLSIKAYDMLNQRKSVQEQITNNTVTFSTYNTLPTYVMLSFTYKLNKLGGRKMNNDGQRPPYGGGGHGMGGHSRPMF